MSQTDRQTHGRTFSKTMKSCRVQECLKGINLSKTRSQKFSLIQFFHRVQTEERNKKHTNKDRYKEIKNV